MNYAKCYTPVQNQQLPGVILKIATTLSPALDSACTVKCIFYMRFHISCIFCPIEGGSIM